MRRDPNRLLAGNLRWTRRGVVWADFLLEGMPYGLASLEHKEQVRRVHTSLFRSLPGESLLLGLCAGLDPAAIVEKMVGTLDLEQHQSWAQECLETMDSLERIGPGERVFWLSVPLGHDRIRDRVTEPMHSSMADLRETLGLPSAGVSAQDYARRAAQAAAVMASLPAVLHPRPVTPAQMMWLAAHTRQRGLWRDSSVPQLEENPFRSGMSGKVFGKVILDEGAKDDHEGRGRLSPHRHRVVKISEAGNDTPPSYQALMAFQTPAPKPMAFPGAELIGCIDRCGVEVDWAIRSHVLAGSAVKTKNQRALMRLNEQFRQGESEVPAAGSTQLDKAAALMAEYVAELESNTLEVEVRPTILFAVGGHDEATADARAKKVVDYFAENEITIARPTGSQEKLWWQMQPGVPTTPAAREFEQLMTSEGLAGWVPLASTRIGAAKGSLLGLNITNGPLDEQGMPTCPTSVVLYDGMGASKRDTSGSIALIGEKGSGKSLTLKKLCGDAVDRGARLIITDRSPVGEYAVWAQAVADAVVIDAKHPQWSLDPLRVFGGETGAQMAQAFLTPLLNVSPSSELGALLSEVLDEEYLAEHHITSLGALTQFLRDSHDPEAATLGRHMYTFARHRVGRAMFDGSIPAINIDATNTLVIRTHSMQLPSVAEFDHEHLFKQLTPEKVYGRAFYAYNAALAHQICFADTSQFAIWAVDEYHHVTAYPEGVTLTEEFLRDDRKHNAALYAASHNGIKDFGGLALLSQFGMIIGLRNPQPHLAKAELQALNLDPDDPANLALVMEELSPRDSAGVVPLHRRGEGILREGSRVAKIKILAPQAPHRAAAALTTPTEDPTPQPTTPRPAHSLDPAPLDDAHAHSTVEPQPPTDPDPHQQPAQATPRLETLDEAHPDTTPDTEQDATAPLPRAERLRGAASANRSRAAAGTAKKATAGRAAAKKTAAVTTSAGSPKAAKKTVAKKTAAKKATAPASGRGASVRVAAGTGEGVSQ